MSQLGLRKNRKRRRGCSPGNRHCGYPGSTSASACVNRENLIAGESPSFSQSNCQFRTSACHTAERPLLIVDFQLCQARVGCGNSIRSRTVFHRLLNPSGHGCAKANSAQASACSDTPPTARFRRLPPAAAHRPVGNGRRFCASPPPAHCHPRITTRKISASDCPCTLPYEIPLRPPPVPPV